MNNIEIDSGSYDSDGGDEKGLNKRRREFENYASAKSREIDEQRMSWRYYHIDQWTPDQLKTLRKRHQPLITFDRTARKIDSLGGTIRRLRTDPKCYPNTPKGEQGAEVATQVIRTICDASFAEDIEVECCKDALIHGIGVDELVMRAGDKGDPDLAFEYVDPRTFFYDPRSLRSNFQDWRYHGIYKWADVEELDELSEGASAKVADHMNGDWDYSTAFDTDRDMLWVDSRRRVRLIDHWYKVGSMWKYCIHTGGVEILSADSPYFNQRGQSLSKFNAFACMVDIDGDHYGFIRRLRGPQDAMNQHRSKAMHIMNTRQIKLKEGAVDDVEITRREASRPDGTLVYRGTKDDLEIVQADSEFLKQTQYYQDAKSEIDTFGPNQQLIQEFGQNVSGRAANMLQQAGLAELGPFLKNYRMWKLARYQACWNAAQRYWTSERMLRVTSDEQVFQFMQINGVELDEYGLPQLVNALGNIDVEIKVDEGPDTETIMGDVFDLLMALSQNNVPVPPAAIIEASYLPLSEKKKLQQMVAQVDPIVQAQKQLSVAQLQANVGKTQAEAGKLQAEVPKLQTAAMLNAAKARTEGMPGEQAPPPSPLDQAEQIAHINETNATAMHKRATSAGLYHKALITPLQMMADHSQQNATRFATVQQQHTDRVMSGLHQMADRALSNFHQNADRQIKKQEIQQRLDQAVERNATPV
jgi:hypothetical protein